MDLESNALSARSGDDPSKEEKLPAGRTSANASGFNSDDDSVSPEDSSQSKERRVRTRNRRSRSRKRKRIEDENAVVIHNVPPKTDRATVKDFVERMLLEMHGKTTTVVECRCMSSLSDRLTFFVAFKTSEFVDLAISLNGVQFLSNTIYVKIYNPDGAFHKAWKLQLCLHSFFGGCKQGNRCRNAHGVLDLKLYYDTVLNENRTVYMNQIPCGYPQKRLKKLLINRLKKDGISPFLTAFHVRGGKGDALVEFADIRHAKKAGEILNGTPVGNSEIEVRPWKPEYKSDFVEYFEDEAQTTTGGHWKYASASESLTKSRRRDDSAVEWEDDKRELRRLRDEVTKLRWQQKRFADLEEELNEVDDEARYYRDRFESERSYAKKDVRRMEHKLDDLRRENDHLIRKYHDLQDELDDTRLEYKQSREQVDKLKRENEALVRENDRLKPAKHRGVVHNDIVDEQSFQDGLNDTKLKYEDSRNQVYKSECEFDKPMAEKDTLVRGPKSLNGPVQRLDSNGNSVKMENEQVPQPQDELQRRLDEALSKIETLNGAVTTTQLQLKEMESERDSMNAAVADLQVQNETLQEEMDQMRMNQAMELGFMGAGE